MVQRRSDVEKFKKFIPYILTSLCTTIIIFSISQGYNNKRIDKISKQLIESESLNTELTEANTRLRESSERLGKRVGELEEQIARDYIRNQERIRDFEKGLSNIANDLVTAEDTVTGIIEGIEQIKKLIESL